MSEPIRVGALAPLSRPGMVAAGEELRAGVELAVRHLAGQGRPLELIWGDTGGQLELAREVVDGLIEDGVHAFLGEFHSVVADAIVEAIDAARIPFVCASATLDAITARRLPHVFRLSPPQSVGWRVFADWVVTAGFARVIIAAEASAYWSAGADVLSARFAGSGVELERLAAAGVLADAVEAALPGSNRRALLVPLVGYPEPFAALAAELGRRGLVAGRLALGDPAGRPALPDWWHHLGQLGAGVPFLAYARPGELSPLGQELAAGFTRETGREPSFVALEAMDVVLALGAALEAAGSSEPEPITVALREIETPGTRVPLRFTTTDEPAVHQQLRWAPLCVVEYPIEGAPPSGAHILHEPRVG
jgi:ABC-type branched-subunit amino acid transport system substrate-binding protein